jgi:hypothetical protein
MVEQLRWRTRARLRGVMVAGALAVGGTVAVAAQVRHAFVGAMAKWMQDRVPENISQAPTLSTPPAFPAVKARLIALRAEILASNQQRAQAALAAALASARTDLAGYFSGAALRQVDWGETNSLTGEYTFDDQGGTRCSDRYTPAPAG